MPVYERRFFLNKFVSDKEKQSEKADSQPVNTKNSKGTRTTKISGETLKARLRSGEIPNQ